MIITMDMGIGTTEHVERETCRHHLHDDDIFMVGLPGHMGGIQLHRISLWNISITTVTSTIIQWVTTSSGQNHRHLPPLTANHRAPSAKKRTAKGWKRTRQKKEKTHFLDVEKRDSESGFQKFWNIRAINTDPVTCNYGSF